MLIQSMRSLIKNIDNYSIKKLEIGVSVLIILTTLPFFMSFLHSMATTSLWNDELYTIMHFSSESLKTTITDYHVPNNHIFFNVLNSIIPWSDPYNPLYARSVSFGAVLGALLILVLFFYKNNYFLEGSLAFMALSVQPKLLHLSLQARGYGLLIFFSITLFISLTAYLKNPSNNKLSLLALATILGTWTVPSFVFFAGPLLLIFFLSMRQRKVFITGLIALFLIIFLHLPVVYDMYLNMQEFAGKWGKQFSNPNAVFQIIKQYLLPFADYWLVFLIFSSALILPFGVSAESNLERSTKITAASIITAFVIGIYLETPLLRTLAFIVIPFALIIIVSACCIIKSYKNTFVKILIYFVILTFCCSYSVLSFYNYQFTPKECWMQVSQMIEKTIPKNRLIYCNFRPHFLDVYLNEGRNRSDWNEQGFAKGELVHVDSDMRRDKAFEPSKYSGNAVSFRIPQRRGGFQQISFVPAWESNIDNFTSEAGHTPEQAIDGDTKTRWTTNILQSELDNSVKAVFELNEKNKYRSLVVYAKNNDIPQKHDISIIDGGGEKRELNGLVSLYPDIMVIELPDISLQKVIITCHPSPHSRYFSINHAWAVKR